ncbi:MAG: HAD family phosphatase [archaeon]
MIKAVLFDLDGTMVEAEDLHSKAYETIIKEYGKKPVFDENGVTHVPGLKEKDTWIMLKEKLEINEDVKVLIEKRNKVYLKLIQGIKARQGLIELLELLENKNLKLAVASSGVSKNIQTVLELLKVKHFFQVIVSGQFVEKSKPEPDIFLEAARKLEVKPEDCLVLEDAQVGVEAGFNAGMKVIAVPNKFTLKHDFSKANKIVNSLKEINWELITSLWD